MVSKMASSPMKISLIASTTVSATNNIPLLHKPPIRKFSFPLFYHYYKWIYHEIYFTQARNINFSLKEMGVELVRKRWWLFGGVIWTQQGIWGDRKIWERWKKRGLSWTKCVRMLKSSPKRLIKTWVLDYIILQIHYIMDVQMPP